MKVLIICSYRAYARQTNYVAPFIYEQAEASKKQGVDIEYYRIKGGGIAYIKAFFNIKQILKIHQVDVIHAHGGLCGFVSNNQRVIPVVITYHGSDINQYQSRLFSKIAIKKSFYNIFVSQKLVNIGKPKRDNYAVIPCGVDTGIFYPIDKIECRKQLGMDENRTYILFSKAFHVKVKNYPLAKAAMDKIDNAELIELKGYTREQVNLLFNACDVALMTSFTEGSPQFIKEAMATNCPIVSTDVGDVKDVVADIDDCYICDYDADDIAGKIKKCLSVKERNGKAREKILAGYSLEKTAKKIAEIYHKL
jgi:glycosyltransferase involved in cell wall biosynthesis